MNFIRKWSLGIILSLIFCNNLLSKDNYLVAEWKLDEGRGNIVNDSSENENSGVIKKGNWEKQNTRYILNLQKNGEISLPKEKISDFNGKSISMELWVASDAWEKIQAWSGLIGKYSAKKNSTKNIEIRKGYTLQISPEGILIFSLMNWNNNENKWTSCKINMGKPANSFWYHLALVYNHETQRLIGYLNGERFDEINTPSFEWSDATNADLIIKNISIAGFRLYKRPLVSMEIKKHFEDELIMLKNNIAKKAGLEDFISKKHTWNFDVPHSDDWKTINARISNDPKDVISGRSSLLFDAVGTSWSTEFLSSNPHIVKMPNHCKYILSFDYKIIETFSDDSAFKVSLKSTKPANLEAGGTSKYPALRMGAECSWRTENQEVKHKEVILNDMDLPFTSMVADADYSIVFSVNNNSQKTHEKGKIAIDNIELKIEVPKNFYDTPTISELVFPRNKMKIADCAQSFCWTSADNAKEYEIQIAGNKNFSPCSINLSVPDLSTNWGVFNPRKLLDNGTWYWRVRSINYIGKKSEWSKIYEFESFPLDSLKSCGVDLEKPIPNFIFYSPTETMESFLAHWDSVPALIRPNTKFIVSINLIKEYDDVLRICACLDELKKKGRDIPEIYLNVRLWSDLGGKLYDTTPLSMLEWIFQQNYTWLKGVFICEQHLEDVLTCQYISRLLPLCAKYGKHIVWTDFTTIVRLRNEDCAELYSQLVKYNDYVTLGYKWVNAYAPQMLSNYVFGFYVSNEIKSLGVGCEAWYWNVAKFGELGTQPLNYTGKYFPPEDYKRCYNLFPDSFWCYEILLGLAQGTNTFVLEGAPFKVGKYKGDFWREKDLPSPALLEAIYPMLEDIVKYKFIPNKDAVKSKVKAGCFYDKPYPTKLTDPFCPFKEIYDALYNLKHNFESVPNSGRYYFIPTYMGDSLKTEDIGYLKEISLIKPYDNETPEKIRHFFDSLYPIEDNGNAFVVSFKNFYIVLNSNENLDIFETFNLKFEKFFIKKIKGKIGVHQYLVTKVIDDKTLFLHLNNRAERESMIEFECLKKPELKVVPDVAILNSKWDDEKKIMTVKINHREGAVRLFLSNAN